MATAIEVVSHAKIIMSQARRFRAGSKNGGKNGESCAGCCSNHGPIALKKKDGTDAGISATIRTKGKRGLCSRSDRSPNC